MKKVSVALGVTKNLGNFESLRVDVGIEKETEDKGTLYKEVELLLEAAVDRAMKNIVE